MPEGEEIVTAVDDELIAMHPISIAPPNVVVTPGMVAEMADAPVAVVAGTSRGVGVVLSTPK
jgi:hypothetical protein